MPVRAASAMSHQYGVAGFRTAANQPSIGSAKSSEVMPTSLRVPDGRLMPCPGSTIGAGMQTSTPPMASTMSRNPEKSTTT